MMIALMIPFSASAAESYSAKYKLAVDATDTDKVGNYTFSFFKIADLNLTTGKYTSTIDDTALEDAVMVHTQSQSHRISLLLVTPSTRITKKYSVQQLQQSAFLQLQQKQLQQ